MPRFVTLACVAVLAGGCLRPLTGPPPVEPGTNLAAYLAHGRIVLQRLPGGGSGAVEPPGGLHFGTPSYDLVDSAGGSAAELRVTAPATVAVYVRDRSAGTVEPSWNDNAIRFALRGTDGTRFDTDTFARVAAGTGPSTLSRNALTNVDVRGIYRAAVRDAAGNDVGWIRVRVSPYQESPRIYDGVLPTSCPPAIAAAVPLALDSEIDWIEAHAIDVYRGGGAGDGIRQGIPLGR